MKPKKKRAGSHRAPARTAWGPAGAADRTLFHRDEVWVGSFSAMASPCEVLVDTRRAGTAARLLRMARQETLRIERKFSRYRDDSVVHRIHMADGHPVPVDEETGALLDFADRCYRLSGGSFDVTSGVLRRVWRFDGSNRLPAPEAVEALKPLLGWEKVAWVSPYVTLPPGMEIDLGGIGKEYAVDRVHALIAAVTPDPFLVNFGGDLRASAPRSGDRPWRVGIDDPRAEGVPVRIVELSCGALATSGDSRRYLLRDGVRYAHVLDPKTGWPVAGAPRSVTIAAPTCTEAGMLATFAMLRGAEAEAFLAAEGARYWCVR